MSATLCDLTFIKALHKLNVGFGGAEGAAGCRLKPLLSTIDDEMCVVSFSCPMQSTHHVCCLHTMALRHSCAKRNGLGAIQAPARGGGIEAFRASFQRRFTDLGGCFNAEESLAESSSSDDRLRNRHQVKAAPPQNGRRFMQHRLVASCQAL